MNQRQIWLDPIVVAARRPAAEAFMGRELELPGRVYDETERRIAAAHLALVAAEPNEPESEEAIR